MATGSGMWASSGRETQHSFYETEQQSPQSGTERAQIFRSVAYGTEGSRQVSQNPTLIVSKTIPQPADRRKQVFLRMDPGTAGITGLADSFSHFYWSSALFKHQTLPNPRPQIHGLLLSPPRSPFTAPGFEWVTGILAGTPDRFGGNPGNEM